MQPDRCSVSVAMATLNGQAFLGDQLLSLRNQTRLPEELVICDDGSSDATIDIATRFAATAPFEVRLERNSTRLGHAKNFLRAASLCRGDLVAFCDQDDVWLENKLAASAAVFEAADSPSIAVHSARVVDASLSPLGYDFPPYPVRRRVAPTRCEPCRGWVGFALTFRRALLTLVPVQFFDDVARVWPGVGHDHWVCFLAGMDRGFFFQREALALYRQHAANASGARVSGGRAAAIARGIVTHVSGDETSYLERAALTEAWADVIARAHQQAALGGNHMMAARWEGIHRTLAARLRTRASIYRPGAAIAPRLRGTARLVADGAYTASWNGGLGRRAILKDAAVAAAGIPR
jgi:glycosyltransferase involved in cell wall biosynthesis